MGILVCAKDTVGCISRVSHFHERPQHTHLPDAATGNAVGLRSTLLIWIAVYLLLVLYEVPLHCIFFSQHETDICDGGNLKESKFLLRTKVFQT